MKYKYLLYEFKVFILKEAIQHYEKNNEMRIHILNLNQILLHFLIHCNLAFLFFRIYNVN